MSAISSALSSPSQKTDASAHWPRPPAPSPRAASSSQSTMPHGTLEARIRSLCVCVLGARAGSEREGRRGSASEDYGGAENDVRARILSAYGSSLCALTLSLLLRSMHIQARGSARSERCTKGPCTIRPRTHAHDGQGWCARAVPRHAPPTSVRAKAVHAPPSPS